MEKGARWIPEEKSGGWYTTMWETRLERLKYKEKMGRKCLSVDMLLYTLGWCEI